MTTSIVIGNIMFQILFALEKAGERRGQHIIIFYRTSLGKVRFPKAAILVKKSPRSGPSSKERLEDFRITWELEC